MEGEVGGEGGKWEVGGGRGHLKGSFTSISASNCIFSERDFLANSTFKLRQSMVETTYIFVTMESFL